eukprot:jgi/Botrbrau1/19570/Bobra.0035s0058.2
MHGDLLASSMASGQVVENTQSLQWNSLPHDTLCAIFSLLDPRTLLLTASIVCKDWLKLARHDDVWAPKLANVTIRNEVAGPLWELWLGVFKTNLLECISWEDLVMPPATCTACGRWVCTRRGGDGVLLDKEQTGAPHKQGAHTLPRVSQFLHGYRGSEEVSCALTTSYNWCNVLQCVDLVSQLEQLGLSSAAAETLLDRSPPLEFTIWVGSRFDCAGNAKVTLFPGCWRLGPFLPATYSTRTTSKWTICTSSSNTPGYGLMGGEGGGVDAQDLGCPRQQLASVKGADGRVPPRGPPRTPAAARQRPQLVVGPLRAQVFGPLPPLRHRARRHSLGIGVPHIPAWFPPWTLVSFVQIVKSTAAFAGFPLALELVRADSKVQGLRMSSLWIRARSCGFVTCDGGPPGSGLIRAAAVGRCQLAARRV